MPYGDNDGKDSTLILFTFCIYDPVVTFDDFFNYSQSNSCSFVGTPVPQSLEDFENATPEFIAEPNAIVFHNDVCFRIGCVHLDLYKPFIGCCILIPDGI